jgi:hypothetical protein
MIAGSEEYMSKPYGSPPEDGANWVLVQVTYWDAAGQVWRHAEMSGTAGGGLDEEDEEARNRVTVDVTIGTNSLTAKLRTNDGRPYSGL